MTIKKIITAVIFSVLISAGLYYGAAAITLSDGISAVLKNKFDLTMCVIIGAMFGIVYIIYSIKKAALSEDELKVKKQEYFYNSFKPEEKEIIDAMSNEDKEKFYVSYEQVLSDKQKHEVTDYLFPYRSEQVSGGMKILRKVALLALIGFIGYYGYGMYTGLKPELNAYAAEQNKTYDDQTLYIDGLPPIELRSDGAFKQKDIDKFIEDNIKTQPAWLLSYANGIVLNSESKYLEYGRKNDSIGFSTSNNMISYFKQSEVNIYDITHELCHLYDYSFEYKLSDSQDFISFYNAKPDSISSYGSTAVQEFFAEAGAMYINNPEQLKQKNIDVYNYFYNLFSQYQ